MSTTINTIAQWREEARKGPERGVSWPLQIQTPLSVRFPIVKWETPYTAAERGQLHSLFCRAIKSMGQVIWNDDPSERTGESQ